jgi:hypothetical protein
VKPSKKDIKAAIEKLHDNKPSTSSMEQPEAKLSAAKPNKNRIRKQGI